jgi:hypothetical protein
MKCKRFFDFSNMKWAKILLIGLVLLAFNQAAVHFHPDNSEHHECPLCNQIGSGFFSDNLNGVVSQAPQIVSRAMYPVIVFLPDRFFFHPLNSRAPPDFS